VIKNNLAGALLSQFAQTTALVLSALTEYQVRVHALRLTTCLNLLGISVMLRDTGKLWELVKTKMLSIAARKQRRIYVVEIVAESKDQLPRRSGPVDEPPKKSSGKKALPF